MASDTQGMSNVLPILDVGEHGDAWVLAMPLAEMNLRQHLVGMNDGLPAGEARKVLMDIARALAEIEGKIVHRDLKPDNILLWQDSWHVTDFGIARYADAATATETWKGAKSHPYAAPEQWKDEHAESRTDVYAFGVIAYEVLTGRQPFAGPSAADFRSQHLTGSPLPIEAHDVNARLSNLVEWCLSKLPSSRPSASKVLEQIDRIHNGSSPVGLESLVEAQRKTVQQRTEEEAQAEEERIRRETRERRYLDAKVSLVSAVQTLWRTIDDTAPAIVVDPLRTDKLSDGHKIALVRRVEVDADVEGIVPIGERLWGQRGICFDVIAQSGISIAIRNGRRDARRVGGCYTWWYCDAQEENHFRWYEVSFTLTGSTIHHVPWTDPIWVELPEAAQALETGHGMDSPFVPIDAVDANEFATRWATWIGDAISYERLPELRAHDRADIRRSYRC